MNVTFLEVLKEILIEIKLEIKQSDVCVTDVQEEIFFSPLENYYFQFIVDKNHPTFNVLPQTQTIIVKCSREPAVNCKIFNYLNLFEVFVLEKLIEAGVNAVDHVVSCHASAVPLVG